MIQKIQFVNALQVEHSALVSEAPSLALGSKRDFGCVGDNVADDTAALQAFFADTSNRLKVLEAGQYRYSSPLNFPVGGSAFLGMDGTGSFSSVLRPVNCRAFSLVGVHHALLSNVTIWPQGNTPPDATIYLSNSYSLKFRDVRIHQGGAEALPTDAVVVQDAGCNALVFDGLTVRKDNSGSEYTAYRRGFWFKPNCGTSYFTNLDLEACQTGFDWEGGKVTMVGLYSEALNIGLDAHPSTDASASFCLTGGYLQATNSGIPIALRNGAKNLRLGGLYVDRLGGAYDTYVYGLVGSKNIYLDAINYDASKVGTEYSPMTAIHTPW